MGNFTLIGVGLWMLGHGVDGLAGQVLKIVGAVVVLLSAFGLGF